MRQNERYRKKDIEIGDSKKEIQQKEIDEKTDINSERRQREEGTGHRMKETERQRKKEIVKMSEGETETERQRRRKRYNDTVNKTEQNERDRKKQDQIQRKGDKRSGGQRQK